MPDPKLVNPLPQIHPLEICSVIHVRDANANQFSLVFDDVIK